MDTYKCHLVLIRVHNHAPEVRRAEGNLKWAAGDHNSVPSPSNTHQHSQNVVTICNAKRPDTDKNCHWCLTFCFILLCKSLQNIYITSLSTQHYFQQVEFGV
jgi:hypothetical protein